MTETPLNFAVVGCGMLAQSAHLPNIVRSQRMRLHTCCDLSEDNLDYCRQQFGPLRTTTDFHAAVADPEIDVICLATTERLREPVIAAAAEAGKAVYCEKPLARSLEEMRRIQQVVHEANIPFCVGHNRRSAPVLLEAHRIFRRHMNDPQPCPWRYDREGSARPDLPEEGVAGMSVRINDDWHSWKRWVFDKAQAPHGPMLFEMTHFTDLCNWFLAARPVEVVAIESGMLNHGVVIRYETGELATITMCANGSFGYPKELYEMFGNGGVVVVDHLLEIRTAGIAGAPVRQTFPLQSDRHPDVGAEGGLPGWLAKMEVACREAAQPGQTDLVTPGDVDKGHARALERFVDEIRGVGPMVCGVDDAVLATRVAFAAVRSARKRRAVQLEEV